MYCRPCAQLHAADDCRPGNFEPGLAPDFKPFRVDVQFIKCKEAAIKPLIEKLSFIKSKTHWGAAFRFGQLKIPQEDFLLIAKAMGCEGAFEHNAL